MRHKESLKDDFVKVSEKVILKPRNSLRNDIVRFPEKLKKQNRSGLTYDCFRLPLIKLFTKITFAMIKKELVMKYKGN